jgi:hypothetical protein
VRGELRRRSLRALPAEAVHRRGNRGGAKENGSF